MQALTTTITLTEPMRSCVVATQIIAAAKDIEAILEAAKLDDGKIIDNTNIKDEVTKLKGLVKSINDARIDPFREIENLRSEFKSQIDTLIINQLSEKIREYETKIREHNAEVRRQEIAAAIRKTETREIEYDSITGIGPSIHSRAYTPTPKYDLSEKPIHAAIPVRQKAYVCECIDLSKVPESHKMTVFDQKKADADVKCGLRVLAGCRIYRPK